MRRDNILKLFEEVFGKEITEYIVSLEPDKMEEKVSPKADKTIFIVEPEDKIYFINAAPEEDNFTDNEISDDDMVFVNEIEDDIIFFMISERTLPCYYKYFFHKFKWKTIERTCDIIWEESHTSAFEKSIC
jgi:hypothetical protein